MKKFLKILPTVAFLNVCAHADVVENICFEGLDRVEEAAVIDSVTIKPGKHYTQSDIDDSLKALFKKDFFSYIKFVKKGNTLIIKCVERPMVDRVAFEGNDAASKEMLKNIVGGRIGEGRLYSSYVVKDILSDLQMAYKTLGFYSTIITPKIIKRPGNKIDLVFEIKEGSKTTVKKILFVGNKSFSDDELKDILTTKEEKIWRFWNYESHIFREDKLDVDIESLTNFYKDNGYPFFMVVSTRAEMDYDKKSHYCTFMLEEGDLYHIKDVSLKSEVDNVNADDFKHLIEIKSNKPYNQSLINSDKDRIRKEVALNDHPFIDVIADISYDKKAKTAVVIYSIVNRPKTFIEKIEIRGNSKTLDRVIRREFRVHEGDAFNVHKIQKTIERLNGIGYFDDVQVNDTEGSADDKKNLIVTVKEKDNSTQLRFGLNVSDADGFGGIIGFSENNMFGTGRSLSMDAFWMQKYYGCKASIFDPHFMDKNFGVGVSVGAHKYNRKNVDNSLTKSIYIAPYISYRIRENLIHKLSYTISKNKRQWWSDDEGKAYDRVPDHANETIIMKDEYGSFLRSELSSVLVYDATDNPYEPRRGYDISLTNSFAGLGGSVRYLKNELEGRYYYPLTKKITFVANASIGYMHEIRNSRSDDRYALGGDQNLRGFDSCGVGPRDLEGNSVGGNKYWSCSFMLKAPLSTKEMGINGVAFLDFGSAWGTRYNRNVVNDSSTIRASIGVGIEWAKTPIGMPIAFMFGFPLKKKSFDEKQTFTISGFM